jgi:hypothetical protein
MTPVFRNRNLIVVNPMSKIESFDEFSPNIPARPMKPLGRFASFQAGKFNGMRSSECAVEAIAVVRVGKDKL